MLAMQISAGGLQSVPIDLFYGLIVAHGLFFGMAFMGMANLAISMGNYWQGMVAERMG
jgi:hypothetical protein